LSIVKSLDYQVVEWINPVDANKLGSPPESLAPVSFKLIEDYESLSRKFALFLEGSQRAALDGKAAGQIVLIQDLLNTFGSSSFVGQIRMQFQNAFKEFLASGRTRYPVVLVVTESEVGSGEDFGYSSSSRDGLTVQHLLGDEILNNRAATHITYRPPFVLLMT
jgi:hypothetical protein